MKTTMLNTLHQTGRLGGAVSTGVYDDGELDALFGQTADCTPNRERETQALSPELLAQILAGGFDASNARVGNDGTGSNFNR